MFRMTMTGLALTAVLSLPAAADVKLAALFSDHAVLQADLPLPVWGRADPGEKVTITVNGQTAQATTAADGRWQVRLKPMPVGGPFEITCAGKNTVTVKDVLLGEVWFCSGQSNMEMPVAGAQDAEKEIAAADLPRLRQFTVKKVVGEQPLTETEGEWVVCSPATAGSFSATAFFFGRELQRTHGGVAVGLINSSWGGSQVEAWMDMETLRAVPEAKPIVERWDKVMADWPAQFAKYQKQVEDWTKKLADMGLTPDEAKKRPKAPQEPRRPFGPGNVYQPGGICNGMLAPVAPYGIRGVIWYQGESNRERGYQYRALFPAMIQSWRKTWGQGDFPFLFVQLPGFDPVKTAPAESELAELREAQAMTLKLPRTGMAVTIDIGDAANIHPKNKQDVGTRLARVAEAVAYGSKGVLASGPMFKSVTMENGKARVRFAFADGGLEAKGGAPLKGFAIAGEDRVFVWADAAVEGADVLVSNAQVPKPVAVRYAWADTPECNLVGTASGLPTAPFRTDDWRVGPMYNGKMTVDKGKARVFFSRVGAGELSGRDGQPIAGFQVTGDDRKFVPAVATVLGGSSVVVSSPEVPTPVAVRYAWPAPAAKGNLITTDGVDAVPFRTDDWPDAAPAK